MKNIRFIIKNGLVSAIRVFGVLLNFAQNLIFGFILGSRVFGELSISMTIVNLASTIGKLGLDIYLLKEASLIATTHCKKKVIKQVFAICFYACLIVCLTTIFINNYFFLSHSQGIKNSITILSLAIPAVILVSLMSETLKVFGRYFLSQIIQSTLLPLAFIFTAIILILTDTKVYYAYYLAGIIVFSTTAIYLHISKLIGFSLKPGDFKLKRKIVNTHISNSVFYYGFSVVTVSLVSADILILSIYEEASDVGAYVIAAKLASSIMIILSSANTISASSLANAFGSGDISKIEFIARQSLLSSIVLGVPVLIVLVVFSQELLGFINNDFIVASDALRILLVGQAMNILTGPVQMILLMTNSSKELFKAAITSLGLLCIGCFILVPIDGINGAAISATASISLLNITSFLYVKYKLGINLFYVI